MRFGLTLRNLAIAILSLCASACTRPDQTPPINREKLEISLERTGCYGSCPAYLVTIDGHGNVVFQSRDFGDGASTIDQIGDFERGILFPGRHLDKISEAAVDDLVARFREVRFFELKDEYIHPVTDNPTYVVTIDTGNGKKTTVDYVGEEAGMPASVTALEEAIDRAAGTKRWVRGTAELLPWLDKLGFDFRSDLATAIAIFGARRDAEDSLLVGMIERGLPLNRAFHFGEHHNGGLVGEELARQALRNGQPQTLERLAKAGWLDRLGRAEAGRILADGAAGCSPNLVDMAAKLQIPLDLPGTVKRSKPESDPYLASLSEEFEETGRTALAALSDSYACDYDENRRVETARRLLRNGADPNRRDTIGETAIFNVENVALLDLLYAHGADATVENRKGASAVFSSWTDDIVLRHLQRGASYAGTYHDGKTISEQMKNRPMPKAARWFKENGR